MSEQIKFKSKNYSIVLKSRTSADISVQADGRWVFFIVNLVRMVYVGGEYVQPCLYARKDPKSAVFGGIRHYNFGLPVNPIIKRVFIKWRKENPRDEKHRIGADKIIHFYPAGFDGLSQLISDYPEMERQRELEYAEEAAHYEALLESGYFDDDSDYEDYGYGEY